MSPQQSETITTGDDQNRPVKNAPKLGALDWIAIILLVAGGICVGTGLLPTSDADDIMRRIWPILLFLATVLVLAELTAQAGLFDVIAAWLARTVGRRFVALFGLCVVFASVTTITLNLDTTAVLLTPVSFAAWMRFARAASIAATMLFLRVFYWNRRSRGIDRYVPPPPFRAPDAVLLRVAGRACVFFFGAILGGVPLPVFVTGLFLVMQRTPQGQDKVFAEVHLDSTVAADPDIHMELPSRLITPAKDLNAQSSDGSAEAAATTRATGPVSLRSSCKTIKTYRRCTFTGDARQLKKQAGRASGEKPRTAPMIPVTQLPNSHRHGNHVGRPSQHLTRKCHAPD